MPAINYISEKEKHREESRRLLFMTLIFINQLLNIFNLNNVYQPNRMLNFYFPLTFQILKPNVK